MNEQELIAYHDKCKQIENAKYLTATPAQKREAEKLLGHYEKISRIKYVSATVEQVYMLTQTMRSNEDDIILVSIASDLAHEKLTAAQEKLLSKNNYCEPGKLCRDVY
jgi:hypothetical protein